MTNKKPITTQDTNLDDPTVLRAAKDAALQGNYAPPPPTWEQVRELENQRDRGQKLSNDLQGMLNDIHAKIGVTEASHSHVLRVIDTLIEYRATLRELASIHACANESNENLLRKASLHMAQCETRRQSLVDINVALGVVTQEGAETAAREQLALFEQRHQTLLSIYKALGVTTAEEAIDRVSTSLGRLDTLGTIYEALNAKNADEALTRIGDLKRAAGALPSVRGLRAFHAFHTIEAEQALTRTLSGAQEPIPYAPQTKVVFANRERDTNTSARAVVQVTLEVIASSRWGRDTTIAQADTQAIDDAQDTLARLLHQVQGVRVVGKPSLVSIILDSKESKR